MDFQIEQRGNEHTNYSSRKGEVPIAFAEHITGNTAESADSWFRNESNNVSSANFMVTKLGKIMQYVDIENMSWCTGLTSGLEYASSKLVHEKYPINPNQYTISIEHESIDGKLTDIQLEVTIWLHKYIAEQVKEIYDVDMIIDRDHLIGHHEVDSFRKWYCPCDMNDEVLVFPFDKIIDGINEVSKDTPSDWAKESWEWGIENNITTGERPKENITRQEVVQMLYNQNKIVK